MIPNYPCVAMLVTGCLHVVLGVVCNINAINSFLIGPCSLAVSVGGLIVGIWISLVGSLGLETGIQMDKDMKIRRSILLNGRSGFLAEWEALATEKIRKLKCAYMVTAILSACIFSVAGLGVSITVLNAAGSTECLIKEDSYSVTGKVGILISILECILAIVSSSICCCCSSNNTTTMVQAPIQIINTLTGQSRIQYQSLPNTTREYLQPINTMQNSTPGYGAVLSNPPAYQQYADSTNAQQQDLSPLQAY